MNLISLLILPAVINVQDNEAARYTIAGIALIILIGAIAFSKRKAEAMDAGIEEPAGAMAMVGAATPQTGVGEGDAPTKLAADALDRWIMDLGDEDADLRAQLREARSRLSD
jgi:K(+)-stimulated pyrophosphate-energized sodium pump